MQKDRLKMLLEMLSVDANDPFLRFAIAKEYEHHQRTHEAITHYSYLIEHHPDYTGTYLHYGQLLESIGHTTEARKIGELGIQACLEAAAHKDKLELMAWLNNMDEDA